MNFSNIGRAALLAAQLAVAGCVEYHPYDTRISGPTGINARNIARIERECAGKRTLRFAVISDTQRWYDETEAAVKALNARNDIDFVLHAGDLADFGLRAEFERQRDILDKLRAPYVALLGNHDCLGTGREVFRTIFGEFDMAFTAGNVRFVCVNTNALEFDNSQAVPDMAFMERECGHFPDAAEKTVVAMHVKPYDDQFDNGTAGFFHDCVSRFPGLQFCVNGHGHSFAADDLFGDGIIYYMCDNIGKRTYLLFTIDDKGYEYGHIAF
ncbi:MAG: metallophosphoesterase [Alistipes sp.]|nr:metallophosphoesterase [Alistipes sp.]